MKNIVLMAVASLACVQTVHARDNNTGGYIGGSLVRGTITEVYRVDIGTPGADVNRNSYGARLEGGYAFNRYFAAELNYTDGLTAVDDVAGTGGSSHSELKVRTAGLAGIGRLPLGDRYSIFGKVGYSNWNIRGRHEDRPAGFPVEASSNAYSGWDISYGGGLGMQLSNAIELRAEYEVSKLYSDIELHAFLVGATWRF